MRLFIRIWLFAAITLTACVEQKDTLAEQPEIELMNPLPCDTLVFGQTFRFIADLSDNVGLGSLSMDIHHNFGHHNHGNHESCQMDPVKDAVNPYEETWIFELPATEQVYMLDTNLFIPSDKESVPFDTGDYHFHFYITDSEGYLTFTTMDVKVLVNN